MAKMNHTYNTSCTSGTTYTTMTLLDDASRNGGDCGGSSILSNGDGDDIRSTSRTSPSRSSYSSSAARNSVSCPAPTELARDMAMHKIYNYKLGSFADYTHRANATSEDICIDFCRSLHILPTARLLFGLRSHDHEGEWAVPGKPLRPGVRYCFRMRFKVPALDTQLQVLDPNAYEYLYRQMRYDMVHEAIAEIRYPAKKDYVMGLGVVDMYIDLMERRDTADCIEANYKSYLPRKLVKAHKIFATRKIEDSFRQFRSKSIDLGRVKWNYVHEMQTLAPNYLLERYRVAVDNMPGDEQQPVFAGSDGVNRTVTEVYARLDLYDTAEPGFKISLLTSEDKLKWLLVAKLEDIYTLYIDGNWSVRLEITGFPNGYRMQFENTIDMESFITYLAGYIRLTTKWMLDLCVQYVTPSLQELKNLRCHGPIGGSYSFAKIREKRNQCGSYIVRQCEKEYDTYYIDINTKSSDLHPEKCKTETFKIKRDNKANENVKWLLHCNDEVVAFDKLTDVAQYIPTASESKFRIPPSEYDKPALLLICLPKNLQSKKTETELSDAELQRKRVQIFDPRIDLQVYNNSQRLCDGGKMEKMRADWIPEGRFKDVCVTLKVLKSDRDFPEFMKLANTWSQIYSPQFIKLYGLTLSTPYTMVMEHSRFGPLNEFLQQCKERVAVRALLDVVHGLVRGIVFLQEYNIIHGFIRCANLYVTKYNLKLCHLEAKIADPGLPRPYTKEDLPWLPFEYYRDMQAAKRDPYAELWAFATTVWEIFARGKSIGIMSPEELHQNYNRLGGILPPPPGDDCPEDMYKTMMDGWNASEPDKRFNHQEIFARLIQSKETPSSYYASVTSPREATSDTSSLHSEFSSIAEGTQHSRTQNGQHGNDEDVLSWTFSHSSGNGERAPLLHSYPQSQGAAVAGPSHSFIPPHAPGRSYFDDTPLVLQIPNGKVIYNRNKKLGEGHYGTVYLGEIRYNTPGREREQVAIKTLKSRRPTLLNKDFMREIQIMQSLDHPNIVRIKQWIDEPLSIIMEYFERGCLMIYLSSQKPTLTNELLLCFALDIAKGMEYLRNQKIIHRDLAARNILVDRDRLKISDFGLAQMANADGYYIAHSEREIPIKWYSPESIKTEKFSFQSDVWSYGVTLFEIFSRGDKPDLDPDIELKQEEFLNRLERGDRFPRPSLCPEIVYEKLMLTCWHANPKMRPNFTQLIEDIQSIRNESGEGI